MTIRQRRQLDHAGVSYSVDGQVSGCYNPIRWGNGWRPTGPIQLTARVVWAGQTMYTTESVLDLDPTHPTKERKLLPWIRFRVSLSVTYTDFSYRDVL